MCFAVSTPVSSAKMLWWDIIARRRRCLFFNFWYMQMHVMYREIWVHPLNRSMLEKGEFYSPHPNLRHYPQKFFTFYRMPVAKFDEMLPLIAPKVRRKSSNFWQPTSPEQQLVLTLRCVLSIYYHCMLLILTLMRNKNCFEFTNCILFKKLTCIRPTYLF